MRAARDVGEALGEEIEREGRAQVVELMHADAREVEAAALEGRALRADGPRQYLLEPALVAETCHRLMVGEARDGGEMAAAHVEREDNGREQQQEQRGDDEEALLRIAVEQGGKRTLVAGDGGLLVDGALDGRGIEVRDLFVEDAHEDGVEAVADGERGAVREDDVVFRHEAVEEAVIEQRVGTH